MNKNEISSSFFYYDEDHVPAYRIEYFSDGTFRYMVRGAQRRYKEGVPAQYFPYGLQSLLNAENDGILYLTGNELEAEALYQMGCLATCGIPTIDGGDVDPSWEKYFAGRFLIVLQSGIPQGHLTAGRALAAFGHVARACYVLTPEGLEPGESIKEWLGRREFSRERFADWVAHRVEEMVAVAVQAKAEAPQPPPEVNGNGRHLVEAAELDQVDKFEVGWKDFPLHCLPDAMADYARAMSEAVKVDPTYIALPSLIMAAGLIGNARVIRLSTTWTEPSVLFGCLIADSSTRKSPAMDWAARPVVQMEFESAKEFKERLFAFNIKDAAFNETVTAEPGKEGKGDEPSRPRKPVRRRILISDITIETIIRELENNPRGLILKRDELRAWFSSFGRYKSSGQSGGDLSFWLEVSRASGYIYDRKSGDQTNVVVPHCAISVYGTIQPAVISKVFNRDYFDSGFVSRLILAMPPKRAGRWDRYQADPDVMNRYEYLLGKLRSLDLEYSLDSENEPRELIFTQEGDEVWGQWYDGWEAKQYHAEGDIASLMAKLQAFAARFALIFAVSDFVLGRTDTEHVNAMQISRAIELAEWFRDEAMRVYCFVGMTDDEREAEKLVQKIRDRGGYITARELFNLNRSRYRDKERAELYLRTLVDQKKLSMVDRIPGKHLAVRTTFFTTHTTVLR